MIAERFHFHRRVQAVDESMAEFDAALRNVATYCEFEGTLEEALCDRFVCGLRNEATQRKLLTEHDLTYHEALEIAKGMEAADSNTISLKTWEPSVNKVLHRASLTAVVKQAIFKISAVSRMHIVMLAARRGILLRCASPPTVGSLL